MNAEKLTLAVDLGASGGKCFVGRFGDNSFKMEEIHRFDHEGVPFFLADRDGAVTERTFWNDTGIYREILKGLRAYRRGVGERLDAIGVDAWGADAQWIGADGDSLGKFYCYRDHRLDNMVAEVRARIPAERIYKITGIHFQPFNVSNQALWFVTRRRELLKVAVKLVPAPTLFNYYLGGCTQVDSTWASVTQLMDARRREWSRPVLRALGVPARVLPEIVPPGAVIGQLQPGLAESLQLNRAAIIAVGSHDTASAFAAAPTNDTASALIISSGTWSLVGRLIPKPITTPAAMAANISNEGGIGNTRCLKNCMGTWLVQELLRAWEAADGRRLTWQEVDTMTPAAPPFAALIDPDDARFYNPANMETAIRDYLAATGQPAPAGRGAILRLVYESLALKYRLVNEQLAQVIGRPAKVVHIVGGGSGNKLLNQFTADALGLPVMAGPKEATAVGNLMVQAMGLGVLPDLAAAQPLIKAAFPIGVFQPGDRAPWEAAYERFLKLQLR
ncbi:MAG: rhamnulokinase [Kiritimatiellae bacterium]|nr:rhamnulokinase [Kiritimatiellia bacterium]